MLGKILGLIVVISVGCGAAFAETVDQAVVAQLQQQGYTSVKVSTTWLGRIVIRARLDGGHREIVINPKTGEILRDYSSNAMVLVQDDNDNDGDSSVVASSGTTAAVTATDVGVADVGDVRTGITVLPSIVVSPKE